MHKLLSLSAVITVGLLSSSCTITTLATDPVEVCAASTYEYLVGLDREVLDTTLMPASTRIIGPEDLVTQDYSASRINVSIDVFDEIIRVYCG